MNVIKNKLAQAEFIKENGCIKFNCNVCQFITGTCRIFSAFETTDPDIIKKVTQYLRKEKLKNLSK